MSCGTGHTISTMNTIWTQQDSIDLLTVKTIGQHIACSHHMQQQQQRLHACIEGCRMYNAKQSIGHFSGFIPFTIRVRKGTIDSLKQSTNQFGFGITHCGFTHTDVFLFSFVAKTSFAFFGRASRWTIFTPPGFFFLFF
jgi:hypothetical protein